MMPAKKSFKKNPKSEGARDFSWYASTAKPVFLMLTLILLAFFWLENELALLVLLPVAGWWLGWRAVSRFGGGVKNAFAAGVIAYAVPSVLNALAVYRILSTRLASHEKIVSLLNLRLPLLESVLFNALANFAVFLFFVLASAVSIKIARKNVKN